jgi:hypothetical protein
MLTECSLDVSGGGGGEGHSLPGRKASSSSWPDFNGSIKPTIVGVLSTELEWFLREIGALGVGGAGGGGGGGDKVAITWQRLHTVLEEYTMHEGLYDATTCRVSVLIGRLMTLTPVAIEI